MNERRQLGRFRIWTLATIGSALVLLAFALAASAGQVHLFEENFGSAAQPSLGQAVGLTVDQSTGDLLVLDAAAKTVNRFKPNGEPAPFAALGTNVIDAKRGVGDKVCVEEPSSCDQTPENGLKLENGAGDTQVAVDNSGTITNGNIYVTQKTLSGSLHLVDIFSDSGEFIGQLTGTGASSFSANSRPCGVAVDGNGTVFVADREENKIYKYDPSANPPVNGDAVATFSSVADPCNLAAGAGPSAGALFVNTFFSFQNNSVLKLNSTTGAVEQVVDPGEDRIIAVDPSTGHLYAGSGVSTETEPGKAETVSEYDASGSSPILLSTFKPGPARGLAVDSATGRIYLDIGNPEIRVFGPLVTVPDVTTESTSVTSNTSAIVTGTVNPDGVEVEECLFEYGETESYGQVAPCATEDGQPIGSGPTPVAVHADLGGLAGETRYHYRLVAKNVNATVRGLDRTFKTPSKPTIVAEWAASVQFIEATLKATIDPENSATTFHIEWGLDTSYGQSTAETAVGSDDTEHTVSTVLGELTPGATYHWRVVATNNLATINGPDRTFTTYLPSPLGLPDNRGYEQVSPADKNGGEAGVPTTAGGAAEKSVEPQQASPSGDAVAYGSFTAFGEGAQSAPATSEYRSTFGPSGWTTQNIGPRFEEGYTRDPLVGFSSDLSHGAVIAIEPKLTEDATSGFPNIYSRDNETDVLTAITTEGHGPHIAVPKFEYCLSYAGASANFDHIIFSGLGALNEGEPAAKGFNLYEWSRSGGIQLVSRLPESNAPASPRVATGFGGMSGDFFCVPETKLLRHAISADGSRIFWTFAGTFEAAKNPLYARVNGVGGKETIRLDKPNSGVGGAGGGGEYWDASVDGAKVFFTDAKKLTADGTVSEKPDLYRYDFEAPGGERLTDLSPFAGEAANVQGVVGASEDGSFVYFVAKGVLTTNPNPEGESAIPGKENLYAWHEGEARFVATLAAVDKPDWTAEPDKQSARVTPDGKHLAFLSIESLTGKDNTVNEGSHCQVEEDRLIGSPQCAEVYLYDFEAEGLVCGSCNPSNARPLGAAAVPTWSAPYQQPRYLSDGGSRLFFETLDALDPRDIDGKRDVYEFEQGGVGSCSAQSPTFVPASGGCLYLLSTGDSNDESYLLDASSSGDNVFFSTRQRLVSTDEDELSDVYAVRVGGHAPPLPPPACEGEACREPGTVAPPTSQPGSSSFQGPGNPPPSRRCPKGQHEVRRDGNARCVKSKKHHQGRSRQAHRNRGAAR